MTTSQKQSKFVTRSGRAIYRDGAVHYWAPVVVLALLLGAAVVALFVVLPHFTLFFFAAIGLLDLVRAILRALIEGREVQR